MGKDYLQDVKVEAFGGDHRPQEPFDGRETNKWSTCSTTPRAPGRLSRVVTTLWAATLRAQLKQPTVHHVLHHWSYIRGPCRRRCMACFLHHSYALYFLTIF